MYSDGGAWHALRTIIDWFNLLKKKKKIWICYQLDLFGNWICALDTDIEPVFYGVAYRRRHHHD